MGAIAAGRGRDGVSPRLALAAGIDGDGGDELAGGIGIVRNLGNFEFEVVALGGVGDAGFVGEKGGKGFAGQWVLAGKQDFRACS